jgi:hypothetical protein
MFCLLRSWLNTIITSFVEIYLLGNTESEKSISAAYFVKGKKYYVLIPRKMARVSNVEFRHELSDVTELVLQYAGPNRDFQGANITPKTLGFSSLTKILVDFGEVITIGSEEKITCN